MSKCIECDGKGYVYSNNENGIDEVQRCDECREVATDTQAQDLEDLDRFMDFIKQNTDVKDMILDALNKAMDTNNPYIFEPMENGKAKIPTIREPNSTNNSNT